MIPNIIHFIKPDTSHFTIVHYLAIISAYELNSPDKIYVYCKGKQYNDFLWGVLDKIVDYEYVNMDDLDELCMNKLSERGGMYININMLSLEPLDTFKSTARSDHNNVSDGVLIAPTASNNITKEHLLNIKPNISSDHVYSISPSDNINIQYFVENDNMLTKTFKKYLRLLSDNIEELEIFIERCYSYSWLKLLDRYCDMYIGLQKLHEKEIRSVYLFYKMIATCELNRLKDNERTYDMIKRSYPNILNEYPIDYFRLII